MLWLQTAKTLSWFRQGATDVLQPRSVRLHLALLLFFWISHQFPGLAAALQWEAGPGFRSVELAVPPGGKAGFKVMSPAETGILFTNRQDTDRGLTNQVLLNGAGVACGDVDGDGWCDLYFCGLESPNALYRNLGNWKFQDITREAGVACADQASTGACFADVNGDGHLDLLVNGVGRGTRLFLNDGRGHFREASAASGLAATTTSTALALADVDGDGDLDLYVGNYRTSTIQDEPPTDFRISVRSNVPVVTMIQGRPISPEQQARFHVNPMTMAIEENGEADVLYLNDGHGKFTPVSWTQGSFLDEAGRPLGEPPMDWTLSAMFRDINGDGKPDLYTCSDNFSPDRIWLNLGEGRFQALPLLALRHTSLSSMGADFADLNRDGRDEIFVSDMVSRLHTQRHQLMVDRHGIAPVGLYENRPQFAFNTLFLNRGDGTYAEIGQLAGVEASDWSWSPVFLDVDLDGYEDLLITSGLARSLRDAEARRRIDAVTATRRITRQELFELRKAMPPLDTPNYAFRNRGDLTFQDFSKEWGFALRRLAQGIALADLDNDGDLDVVMNCLNSGPLLCRNESSAPRLALRLAGPALNGRGIGAKMRVNGGPVPQSQEMICGGRYLSCDDTLRVFAAGTMTNRLAVEVTWRDGKVTRLADLRPNRLYEIAQASALEQKQGPEAPGASTSVGPAAPAQTFFQDASSALRHTHVESEFNDFERQPLLPHFYSRLGPGLSWFDFDGNGREDLLVGCGRGDELGVFLNGGMAGFKRINLGKVTGKFSGDVTTILGIPAPEGEGVSTLLGISNYETGSAEEPGCKRFEMWAAGLELAQALAGQPSSVGPMALGDIDGDGQLELFIGGRIMPGRYPEPAASHLYRKVEGKFTPDASAGKMFEKLGLVNGAVFSDLNSDGLPELVLACEWGPVRIFTWQKGHLMERTEALGLSQYVGWWSGVTTADFDGDGRLDIVAGNWGRNSKYQYYAAQPLKLYYGDFNGDGTVQLIEAHYEPPLKKYVPWRFWDTLGQAMPFVQERYGGFAAFSQAGVEEILKDHASAVKILSANTLDSMVFLNRGDHFEAHPLPLEAQLSPVFGVAAADLDGDGNEDIYLSQNFFAVDAETARYDAGLGVWLRGNGRGQFTAVPAAESGLRVYGEGRGAALCDYDGDGRIDLAVAQNGAATKLYHNEKAKPGLRIRLSGSPDNKTGNKTAIGAVLRWVAGGKMGPVREIHAGSGYWSQDSAVQVLAVPAGPVQLLVRWPGGATTISEVRPGTREVVIDYSGQRGQ